MPVPVSGEDTDDALALATGKNQPWMTQRRMCTLMVGMAVAGTALVASVSVNTSKVIYAGKDQVAAISQLSADEDPCKDLPQIRLGQPERKNLANVNSQTDPEGLVFPGTYTDPAKGTTEAVKVSINALPPSTHEDAHRAHGIWGKYAGIAVPGGKSMHLKFSITGADGKTPKILRELDITFFDLDRHGKDGDVEYVKLWKIAHQLTTKDPKFTIKEDKSEESVTYTAETDGTGSDNPTDPLLLTVEQKQKAVTILYEDTSEFEIEVGSTGHIRGNSPRGFIFVFRPSLKCSKTADGEVEVVTVDKKTTTSTTTTTPTTTTEKKCETFKIPIIDMCMDFLKFW